MNLNEDWKTKLNQMAPKKQQLLVILLVGILLVVIALPAKKAENPQIVSTVEKNEHRNAADYEEQMEKKLEELLQCVAGVGKAEVMITLKSTSEKVIEKDREDGNEQMEETDSQGGERKTKDISVQETTIYKGNNENQTPYVKKEMLPEVEGVVVIAQGEEIPRSLKMLRRQFRHYLM